MHACVHPGDLSIDMQAETPSSQRTITPPLYNKNTTSHIHRVGRGCHSGVSHTSFALNG